jgi:hypothetical protein
LSADKIAVDIQYSRDGRTGWSTKKTVQTTNSSQFIVEKLPGYTDGYWRLHYAGSTTKDIKGGVSGSLRPTASTSWATARRTTSTCDDIRADS